MSKYFQIHEDDLAMLERELPLICQLATHDGVDSPSLRIKIRQVKDAVGNVRWNYQPHTDVQRIEGGLPGET